MVNGIFVDGFFVNGIRSVKNPSAFSNIFDENSVDEYSRIHYLYYQ